MTSTFNNEYDRIQIDQIEILNYITNKDPTLSLTFLIIWRNFTKIFLHILGNIITFQKHNFSTVCFNFMLKT